MRIPAEAKTIYHPQWPKISPDDPRLKGYTLCTIRAVCEASANYCLELTSLSLRARTGQKSAKPPGQNNGVQNQATDTEESRSSAQAEEKEAFPGGKRTRAVEGSDRTFSEWCVTLECPKW